MTINERQEYAVDKTKHKWTDWAVLQEGKRKVLKKEKNNYMKIRAPEYSDFSNEELP